MREPSSFNQKNVTVFVMFLLLSVANAAYGQNAKKEMPLYDKAKAHWLSGTKALNRKDYSVAIDEFQKGLKVNYSGANYALHGSLGDTYDEMGNTDKAKSEYSATVTAAEVRLNSSFFWGYEKYNIYSDEAQAYEKLGNPTAAVEAYKNALQIEPFMGGTSYALAKVLRSLGRTVL